jgi:phospholipase/carboxylesterase
MRFSLSHQKNNSPTLICLLHGYGANKEDLQGLVPYLDPMNTYDWLFLDAPFALPGPFTLNGRAWFGVNSLMSVIQSGQSLTDYEPEELTSLLENLSGWFDNFLSHPDFRYKKIILGGFSQGAIVTSHLLPYWIKRQISAATHLQTLPSGMLLFSPALIAQKTLHANITFLESLDASHPDYLKNIPYLITHGTEDQVLPFHLAQELAQILHQSFVHKNNQFLPFQGGHEIPLSAFKAAQEFLRMIHQP